MNNNIYTLEDRGILYLHGDDNKKFLQNIITNDIEKISESKSCFASLLTPQGKYLYDFIIIKYKNGFFIDCEKNQIDNLFKQLNLYKLRSKVEILNLSNEFVVASITKAKFLEIDGAKDEPGFTVKFREDPVLLDPRSAALGARLIINLEKLYLSIKKLNLKPANINEYYELSFKIGIPQVNTKKLQNKLFGIECNFEELNAIDFRKGCYVGQENTARIKLKNKLSKKLFPIQILKGEIKTNDIIEFKGKEIGKILIDDDYPFGLIKFKDENFEFDKDMSCNHATIRIMKPLWLDQN